MKLPKFIKKWLLSLERYWYLDDEWKRSIEMNYVRSPRQFFKNKLFPEYLITSCFYQKPYAKSKAIKQFIKNYEDGKLIDNKVCLIFNPK